MEAEVNFASSISLPSDHLLVSLLNFTMSKYNPLASKKVVVLG